jgi:hypothetical protein
MASFPAPPRLRPAPTAGPVHWPRPHPGPSESAGPPCPAELDGEQAGWRPGSTVRRAGVAGQTWPGRQDGPRAARLGPRSAGKRGNVGAEGRRRGGRKTRPDGPRPGSRTSPGPGSRFARPPADPDAESAAGTARGRGPPASGSVWPVRHQGRYPRQCVSIHASNRRGQRLGAAKDSDATQDSEPLRPGRRSRFDPRLATPPSRGRGTGRPGTPPRTPRGPRAGHGCQGTAARRQRRFRVLAGARAAGSRPGAPRPPFQRARRADSKRLKQVEGGRRLGELEARFRRTCVADVGSPGVSGPTRTP